MFASNKLPTQTSRNAINPSSGQLLGSIHKTCRCPRKCISRKVQTPRWIHFSVTMFMFTIGCNALNIRDQTAFFNKLSK